MEVAAAFGLATAYCMGVGLTGRFPGGSSRRVAEFSVAEGACLASRRSHCALRAEERGAPGLISANLKVSGWPALGCCHVDFGR
jgi:hypothetical protein